MGKPYVMVRHGKRIVVEDLETPNSSARRLRRGIQDGFAMVPLTWAADVAKATNSPAALITSLLVYLSWKAKSPTFTLSNDCLRQFGVNRKAKYRVLARLEKAGLIRVQRTSGRALIVTLVVPPNSTQQK
jgi:hypothetical protein